MSDYKFTQNSVSITMTEDYVRQWEQETGHTVEEHLKAVDDLLAQLFYPHGREEAWDRIDRACSVHSIPEASGTIDRSPSPWWRTKTY